MGEAGEVPAGRRESSPMRCRCCGRWFRRDVGEEHERACEAAAIQRAFIPGPTQADLARIERKVDETRSWRCCAGRTVRCPGACTGTAARRWGWT